MKWKLRKESYGSVLQLWNDERSVCVNFGTINKLVKTLFDDVQSSKLKDKLSSFLREIEADDVQAYDLRKKIGFSE